MEAEKYFMPKKCFEVFHVHLHLLPVKMLKSVVRTQLQVAAVLSEEEKHKHFTCCLLSLEGVNI